MFNLKSLFKNSNDFLPKEEIIRNWQLISKSYAPPRRSNSGLEGLPKDVQERALFGVTVYLWQDKNTGELRKEELLGSDEPMLDELFLKVKQYGPQYIKDDNGEIYELRKYVQQPTNPLDLPLRNPGV